MGDRTPNLRAVTITSTPSFEVVAGWEQLPTGYQHPDVADVAVDSGGRVYLFCRSEHPVLVYERDGRFVRSWGEGVFTMRAHGITMAPDDTIWFTDDGDQTVLLGVTKASLSTSSFLAAASFQ